LADSRKVPGVYSVGGAANSALAAPADDTEVLDDIGGRCPCAGIPAANRQERQKGTDSVARRPAKAVPRTSWRH
jgi:hypothetical protein